MSHFWRKVASQPRNIAGILRHPMNRGQRVAGLRRWAAWQVGARVTGGERVIPFVNDLKIVGTVGMTGPATTAYWGLNEPDDMAFLAHYLRPDDLLADVGANIGLYGVLAAGVAGARAVCFEPLPRLASFILRNIEINGLGDLIQHRPEAVGAATGVIDLLSDVSDVSTRVQGLRDRGTAGTMVPHTTLDIALAETPPSALKIDVEGYEGAVLEGADKCLLNPRLKAVLLEINSNAGRYGYGSAWILNRMGKAGFQPFRYQRDERRLVPLVGVNLASDNTLFLRDPEEARERVRQAQPIRVLGQQI